MNYAVCFKQQNAVAHKPFLPDLTVYLFQLVMAALWNREGHYIFDLWFLLSFFLSSTFFPRLISAVAEWMSAILPHMVRP